MSSELLRVVGAALDAAAIPYMLVGSFASSAHGTPRTTMDIDIVIAPTRETLDAFLAALDLERFYVDADVAHDALRRRSMFNLIDMASGWKIDFVVRKNRPFSIAELERRALTRVVDIELPTATAEDTIVAKLEWAKSSRSERQFGDIAAILDMRGPLLDFEYIARWVEELGLREEWERVQLGMQKP